jgi:hypothetical protein
MVTVGWDHENIISEQYVVNGTIMDLGTSVKALKSLKNE